MSDNEARVNFDDLSKVTPEMVKAEFRKAMRNSPKVNFEEMREKILSPKFKVKLSSEPLFAEGYVSLNAKLMDLRNDLLYLKLEIDEKQRMISRAVDSMEKIFLGMTSGTVRDKNAVVEGWLAHIKIQEGSLEDLSKMASDVLGNLDMAIMQLNRQFRAVDLGARTGLIDVKLFKDLPEENEMLES